MRFNRNGRLVFILLSFLSFTAHTSAGSTNDPVDPNDNPDLFNRQNPPASPIVPPSTPGNTPVGSRPTDCKTALDDANRWLAKCNAARVTDKKEIDALNKQVTELKKTVESLKAKLTLCKQSPNKCKNMEIPQ